MAFWQARKKYKDKPFIPFWEKRKLLREMMPSEAKEVAKNDVFLPGFVKKEFDERKPK